jgi:hypothetical protein
MNTKNESIYATAGLVVVKEAGSTSYGDKLDSPQLTIDSF